jgi:hypothetical protein
MKIIRETCRALAMAWLLVFGARYALPPTEWFFHWRAPGRKWLYHLPNFIGHIGADWLSAWPVLVPAAIVAIVTVIDAEIARRKRDQDEDEQ